MEMKSVEGSSHIDAIGYDAGARKLGITFKDGKTYHYVGVPQELADSLRSADSTGRHFREFIKGKFQHERA